MVPLFLALSCSTEQTAVPEVPVTQVPVEKASEPPPPASRIQEEKPEEKIEEKPEEQTEETSLDPPLVSQEEYDTTIQDIQEMILKLNDIVRAKNFNAWMSFLADSSLERINSREFLEERANDLHKKNQTNAALRGQDISKIRKVNFRGPQDYFNYVVVPSHANDHVDEITFSSKTQVTAYIRDDKGQRLILYDLEKIDGHWKIIIVS
jgi:hypothetical protein